MSHGGSFKGKEMHWMEWKIKVKCNQNFGSIADKEMYGTKYLH